MPASRVLRAGGHDDIVDMIEELFGTAAARAPEPHRHDLKQHDYVFFSYTWQELPVRTRKSVRAMCEALVKVMQAEKRQKRSRATDAAERLAGNIDLPLPSSSSSLARIAR